MTSLTTSTLTSNTALSSKTTRSAYVALSSHAALSSRADRSVRAPVVQRGDASLPAATRHSVLGVTLAGSLIARPVARPERPQLLPTSLLLAALVGTLLLAVLLPEAVWRQLGGPLLTRTVFHGATLAGLLGLLVQIQRHAARQAAAHLSSDVVTGLPGRRGLFGNLQARLQGQQTGQRGGPGGQRPGTRHWSALLIEIDGLADMVQRHGAQVGDEVLRAVASALRQEMRADDLLGRWEGPAFVALLPGTAFEGALVVAERLRRAVSLRTFAVVGSVTVSVGAASWQPGESTERTVARAETGLHHARQGGRNRVAFTA